MWYYLLVLFTSLWIAIAIDQLQTDVYYTLDEKKFVSMSFFLNFFIVLNLMNKSCTRFLHTFGCFHACIHNIFHRRRWNRETLIFHEMAIQVGHVIKNDEDKKLRYIFSKMQFICSVYFDNSFYFRGRRKICIQKSYVFPKCWKFW